jgi:hypothetical protein
MICHRIVILTCCGPFLAAMRAVASDAVIAGRAPGGRREGGRGRRGYPPAPTIGPQPLKPCHCLSVSPVAGFDLERAL